MDWQGWGWHFSDENQGENVVCVDRSLEAILGFLLPSITLFAQPAHSAQGSLLNPIQPPMPPSSPSSVVSYLRDQPLPSPVQVPNFQNKIGLILPLQTFLGILHHLTGWSPNQSALSFMSWSPTTSSTSSLLFSFFLKVQQNWIPCTFPNTLCYLIKNKTKKQLSRFWTFYCLDSFCLFK